MFGGFKSYEIDFGNPKWPCDLPEKPAVYIFSYVKNGKPTPIYIGQTNNFCRRMWNYKTKYFSASTDFSVGTAIVFLKNKGCSISVHYKLDEKFSSKAERVEEEFQLILSHIIGGYHLLNSFPRYNYRESHLKDKIVTDIEKYCSMVLAKKAA